MPKTKEAPFAGVFIEGMSVRGNLTQPLHIYIDDGGKEVEKTCPHCNLRKPLSDFGFRVMREKGDKVVLRLQPWCTVCR